MTEESTVIDAQFRPGQPAPAPREESDISSVIHIITQWRAILNARLLALLALLGALCIFGYAIYDPSKLRLWAASLYSVGVLWPVMALFFRKG